MSKLSCLLIVLTIFVAQACNDAEDRVPSSNAAGNASANHAGQGSQQAGASPADVGSFGGGGTAAGSVSADAGDAPQSMGGAGAGGAAPGHAGAPEVGGDGGGTVGGDGGAGGDSHVPTVDPDECDFIKQGDAYSDFFEPTGRPRGEILTFCGIIPPRSSSDQEMEIFALVDMVETLGDYLIELELSKPIAPYFLQVDATNSQSPLSSWVVEDRATLFLTFEEPSSLYVRGDYTSEINQPIEANAFKLHIRQTPWHDECLTPAPAEASQVYDESDDAPHSHGNDVVRWTRGDGFGFTDVTDQAEPTGFVLDAGERSLIYGTAGSLVYPGEETYNPFYLDGDMYLLRVEDVDQLTVRITPTYQPHALRLYLFEVGSLEPFAGANLYNNVSDYGVMPVMPNRDYWLWVGETAYGTPLRTDYSITLCGTVAP